jgi:hypothetical protein
VAVPLRCLPTTISFCKGVIRMFPIASSCTGQAVGRVTFSFRTGRDVRLRLTPVAAVRRQLRRERQLVVRWCVVVTDGRTTPRTIRFTRRATIHTG